MIKPIVVGSRHADCPILVLDSAMGKPLSGVEDCKLNFVFIQKLEPMARLRAVTATGPAALLPERAEKAVHSQLRLAGIDVMPFKNLIERADDFAQLTVQFHHMPLSVDDSIVSHNTLQLLSAYLDLILRGGATKKLDRFISFRMTEQF